MKKEILIKIKGRTAGEDRRGIIDSVYGPQNRDRRRLRGEEWRFYDLGTRLNVVDEPSDASFVGLIGNEPPPTLDPTKYLEYVEIKVDVPGEFTDVLAQSGVPGGEYDPYGFVAQNVQTDIVDPSDIDDIDRAFLGLDSTYDPFGFSSFDEPPNAEDKKARLIPHCMPIWYGLDDQPGYELATDPEAYDEDDYKGALGYNPDIFDLEAYTDEKTSDYGNANARLANEDIGLFAGIDDDSPQYLKDTWNGLEKVINPNWKPDKVRQDGEQWNDLNKDTDGYLNLKGKRGSVQIRLKSRLAYENFDTGDKTNYKITQAPSYNAAEVSPSFAHKSELKFYLRPKLHAFARGMQFRREDEYSYEQFGLPVDYDPEEDGEQDPGWMPKTAFFVVEADIWRGCHVSRHPVVPMSIPDPFGDWSSYLYLEPPTTVNYADGTSKTVSFSESVNFTGRIYGFSFSLTTNTSARQIYQKRTNRDVTDIVVTRPLANFVIPPTYSTPSVTLLANSQLTWKAQYPIANTQSSLNSEAAGIVSDLAGQLAGSANIRDVTYVSTTNAVTEGIVFRQWIALPIDGKPGQLCAVIVKRKKKYYVWRKTSENRGGLDKNRTIGQGFYQGNIT